MSCGDGGDSGKLSSARKERLQGSSLGNKTKRGERKVSDAGIDVRNGKIFTHPEDQDADWISGCRPPCLRIVREGVNSFRVYTCMSKVRNLGIKVVGTDSAVGPKQGKGYRMPK